MFKRLARTAIVIIAAIGSPSLLAHVVATTGGVAPPSEQGEQDDGWRLTKDGWERLSPRVIAAAPFRPVVRSTSAGSAEIAAAQEGARWDPHPAAVALLLVLGAICAFCLFPNERSRSPMQQTQI